MIDTVIKSISKVLNTQYPDIVIYREDMPQGFIEPCFYIALLNTSKKPLLNNRFILNIPVDVHYFPSISKNKKEEMYNKSIELYSVLKRITLIDDGLLNGFNFNTEIIDNVLHFFVEYRPVLNSFITDDNKMNKIIENLGVNDD